MEQIYIVPIQLIGAQPVAPKRKALLRDIALMPVFVLLMGVTVPPMMVELGVRWVFALWPFGKEDSR